MDFTTGEQLKIALNRSGYTLADISKHTGLSFTTIKKIFNNKGSFGSWMVMCKFLNVRIDVSIDAGGLNCK